MKRILVVDDQKEIRDLISKLLVSSGYAVDIAEDGEVALGQVKRKKYDLIIVDFEMPGMDGITLLENLKTGHPSLPVLMISGSGKEESFFKRSGADAYLSKPLDLFQTRMLVLQILRPPED